MTEPIETHNDLVDSNIIYEIYELNENHWNYGKFSYDGVVNNFVVYVRYLDDHYKHYPLTPVKTIDEARWWIGNEIAERQQYKNDAIEYRGHKITKMTEWQTNLALCGVDHPTRGWGSTGPVVNFGAVDLKTMKLKIDEHLSPERVAAVERAGVYFENMLRGDVATASLSDGCHYCGGDAVSFDIFDAPICSECGGK